MNTTTADNNELSEHFYGNASQDETRSFNPILSGHGVADSGHTTGFGADFRRQKVVEDPELRILATEKHMEWARKELSTDSIVGRPLGPDERAY